MQFFFLLSWNETFIKSYLLHSLFSKQQLKWPCAMRFVYLKKCSCMLFFFLKMSYMQMDFRTYNQKKNQFQVIFHSSYCYPHSDVSEKHNEIFGRKHTSLVNRIHCFRFVVMILFLRTRKTFAKDLFKLTQSYCKNLRSRLKLQS